MGLIVGLVKFELKLDRFFKPFERKMPEHRELIKIDNTNNYFIDFVENLNKKEMK
jgi:hypothetical protein